MKKFLQVLTFWLCLGASVWAGQCPSGEEVLNKLKKLFPRADQFQIESIKPSTVPGFCEVVLKSKGPFRNIIYVDQKGRYAFLGQLIDLEKGQNLTRQKIITLSKLTPEQLKKLDSLVAFTAGEGPKTLYLITDPDCPFCKKLEKTLQELIKEGKITVKVILFPLERLHPKAKEKSIAIICDKKGFEGLLIGYTSSNQCEEGKKKVKEAQKYLFSLGIRGTPTIILTNGKMLRGALPKVQLEKELGL